MNFEDDNTTFCIKNSKISEKFMPDEKFPVYFLIKFKIHNS